MVHEPSAEIADQLDVTGQVSDLSGERPGKYIIICEHSVVRDQRDVSPIDGQFDDIGPYERVAVAAAACVERRRSSGGARDQRRSLTRAALTSGPCQGLGRRRQIPDADRPESWLWSRSWTC